MRGELQLQDQAVLAEIAARRQQVTSANEKFDKLYRNIAQDGGTRVRLDDKEVGLLLRLFDRLDPLYLAQYSASGPH